MQLQSSLPDRAGSPEIPSSGIERACSLLYRAMRAGPDGLPQVGRSSSTLGVRLAGDYRDIAVDSAGIVRPNVGGMSVVLDDPRSLPRARRPRSLGGVGRHPVFCLGEEKLPGLLTIRADQPPHAFVEPSVACRFEQYETALHSTRPDWRKTHG